MSDVQEEEIPTRALVESGQIKQAELTKLRKDYAIAKFREGVSKKSVAKLLGIKRQRIYDWLEHDKEFRDRILRMKSLMALGMFPKAMKTLEESMDAPDGETRRKAANDVLDHGEGRRSREAGLTINADKVTFNNMSTTELANLARELGVGAEPEPVDASKPNEEPEPPDTGRIPPQPEATGFRKAEPEEPKEPDPPPAPEPLPPVVLPAVPPADPPKEAENGE